MDYQIFSGGKGYARDGGLEDIYEQVSIKEQMLSQYASFSEAQVDSILMNEQVSPLQEEVIEELFGKTKAKLAGVKANIGAKATNLKNKVATGASNLAQKGVTAAQNVKNAVTGENPLQPVSQVGNQTPETVDPAAAANAAKLASIAPQIQKTITKASQSLTNDLAALGLDEATLAASNPELAQAIKYSQGWLKAAMTKLSAAAAQPAQQQQSQQPQAAPQAQQPQV